jgi:hypothetical protein
MPQIAKRPFMAGGYADEGAFRQALVPHGLPQSGRDIAADRQGEGEFQPG